MNKVYLLILAVVFVSCSSNTVFEEYKTIEDGSWNTDSILSFNYEVKDTISMHQIQIKVRHTVDYEYQNLFLFVHTDVVDTVELLLADKRGKWYGKGIGSIREFVYVYQKDKVYSEKGKKIISVEQAMRYGFQEKIQWLNNVNDIGIRVFKQDE